MSLVAAQMVSIRDSEEKILLGWTRVVNNVRSIFSWG